MADTDPEDLFQYAYQCLEERRPLFDPREQTIDEYFEKRMDNHVRAICERKENKTSNISIDAPNDDEKSTIVLFEPPLAIDLIDAVDNLKGFIESVMKSRLSNKQKRYVEYRMQVWDATADEDREALGISDLEVYALRKGLRKALIQFFKLKRQNKDDVGS